MNGAEVASLEGGHWVRLVPARAEAHAGLLRRWGAEPHARPWWQLGATDDEVAADLAAQQASAHLTPWIAHVDGLPVAYVETYVTAQDPLARAYRAEPGDRGWHILVGPPGELGSGRPRLVGRAVLRHLLAEGATRIVCEPDVANERMARFCARLGHEELAQLDLPDKRARLLVCTAARARAVLATASDPVAEGTEPGEARGGATTGRAGTDHDVIGVGLGPFNLGLAALLDGVPDVDGAFFEQRDGWAWHPGLLLDGTTLQVPFLADLVTLADPTSPHSFLSYLAQRGRLLRFYFYERFHIPRQEYDAYCRWVAGRLPACRFGRRVVGVHPAAEGDPTGPWVVETAGAAGATTERRTTRAVVLGVGTTPAVPACAREHLGRPGVLHTATYLDHRDELLAAGPVAVIGSGQSAAEVVADLLRHRPGHRRLEWYTRSRGFLPMEYSKLGLEHFTPEYTAYFHALPEARRDEVRAGQDLLYKGISAATSAEIYDLLYERTIDGPDPDVAYASTCELVSLAPSPVPGRRWRLGLRHRDQDRAFTTDVDAVVLGTGHRPAPLPLPPATTSLLAHDAAGRPVVSADHRLVAADGTPTWLFVQHADLHSHGVGAPDLGLGAQRNAVITNAVAGREVYPTPARTVFQTFGVPEGVEVAP